MNNDTSATQPSRGQLLAARVTLIELMFAQQIAAQCEGKPANLSRAKRALNTAINQAGERDFGSDHPWTLAIEDAVNQLFAHVDNFRLDGSYHRRAR